MLTDVTQIFTDVHMCHTDLHGSGQSFTESHGSCGTIIYFQMSLEVPDVEDDGCRVRLCPPLGKLVHAVDQSVPDQLLAHLWFHWGPAGTSGGHRGPVGPLKKTVLHCRRVAMAAAGAGAAGHACHSNLYLNILE